MRSSVLLKSKTQTQPTKTQKISRIRRQRGYHWEDTLVKRFNKLDNWKAFRLGSPSVALPDILSLNNEDSIIFTIEAKSGYGLSVKDEIKSLKVIKELNKNLDIIFFLHSLVHMLSLKNIILMIMLN